MLNIYPVPDGEEKYADLTVTLNGKKADLSCARVSKYPFNRSWPMHQRPLEQTEIAPFINFAADEPVTVRVTAPFEFSDIRIRPLSKKVPYRKEGNSVSFTLQRHGAYTVEFDGFHRALHMFADTPQNAPQRPKAGANTLIFPAGVHHVGQIDVFDGQTIWLDEGAVVYGTIQGRDVADIKVIGHGILDGKYDPRNYFEIEDKGENIYVNTIGSRGCIKFFRSRNILIDGITLRDSSVYALTALGCENVSVHNVKSIGMWRYNSDGFDIINCRHVQITDCFLRNFDDVIVLKGLKHFDDKNVSDIRVSRCVIWCDWGRAMELGAETVAEEFKNIVFEDCDIIHTFGMCMDIQNADRAKIHDVLFKNIRCEFSKYDLPPVYHYPEMTEYPGKPTQYAMLLCAEISCNGLWSDDLIPGEISNIVFEDIFLYTDIPDVMPHSSFSGYDGQHKAQNITVRNLVRNGRRITDIAEANIAIGPYTDNILLD